MSRAGSNETADKPPCVLLRLPFLHPWRAVLEHEFRLLSTTTAAEEQVLINSEGDLGEPLVA